MWEGGSWPGTIRTASSLDLRAHHPWGWVKGLARGWDIPFLSLFHPGVLAHPPDHPPCHKLPEPEEQQTGLSSAKRLSHLDAPLTSHGSADTFAIRAVPGRE